MTYDRRKAIERFVLSRGEVTLAQLETLHPSVSSMTLRRDLIYLERNGVVRRTRGGAISLARTTLKPEDAFIKRAQQRVEQKAAIARRALSYFKSSGTLFLDSGSTLMEFARVLPDDEYLALTSGPNIALELALKTRPEVMLLGGKVAKNNLSVSGAMAVDMIDRVNVDVAFMAASGFDRLSGFTAGSLEECTLKHRVVTRAKQRVVLMDSSKLGLVHAFSYASATEIDVLITDTCLGQETEQYFAQNKVTIVYAQEDLS